MIARNQNNLLPGKYTALGYKATTSFCEAGISASGGTGDYHMRYERETLINFSRMMDRDNWLYEGTLNRWCDYVLGAAGFSLQSLCADERTRKTIEDEIWPAFWARPEVTGQMKFRDCEEINLRELGVAGDQLWLKLGEQSGYGGLLQHIESERITGGASGVNADGSRVEQGVRLNRVGEHVGYFVADVNESGYVQRGGANEVPADRCLFVPGRFKRSSQTRHMPVLLSAMPIAHRIDDILTSEAIAWQVLSRLAFTWTREQHASRSSVVSGRNGRQRDTAGTDEMAQMMTDLGVALMFQAGPKDKLEPVTYNRPQSNFVQSVQFYIRLFGTPLGIPLEVILLDWGTANYSRARATLLQAFINFRKWQQLLVDRFYTRVFRWQIGRAVALGKLSWREDILAHTWNVPGWPWIDEDKEVSAWSKKIDRAIATQTEALASLGKDRTENLVNRKKEIIEAAATAREIEAETGGLVKAENIWRHLAGMETGKTEAAVRAKDAKDAAGDDGQNQPEGEIPDA